MPPRATASLSDRPKQKLASKEVNGQAVHVPKVNSHIWQFTFVPKVNSHIWQFTFDTYSACPPESSSSPNAAIATKKWLRIEHWNHGCPMSFISPHPPMSPQSSKHCRTWPPLHSMARAWLLKGWKRQDTSRYYYDSMTYQNIVEFICSNHVFSS